MSDKKQYPAQIYPKNKHSLETPTGEKATQDKTVVKSPWAVKKTFLSDEK